MKIPAHEPLKRGIMLDSVSVCLGVCLFVSWVFRLAVRPNKINKLFRYQLVRKKLI